MPPLSAALADPGQTPTGAILGRGMHQALQVSGVGVDGEFCG